MRISRLRWGAHWLALSVLVLATLSVGNDVDSSEETPMSVSATDTSASTIPSTQTTDVPKTGHGSSESYDPTAEANKAYKQALHTLAQFSSPSTSSSSGSYDTTQPPPNSFLATLFPNQQGPIASIIRIVYKLRQQSWVPHSLRSLFGLGFGFGIGGKEGGRRREEEARGRAVKVMDLLEHAVELGHMDALHKLAHLSLFHLSPLLHNTTRSFEAFSQHAQLTGNASSQAMLGFFYATGYADVVPVDQAKALLYYTFAAHGGDQGAQMVLGYRHWAGISVNDECLGALEWYEKAADQSMAKFLSGPPGGRTLLHTTTRLSDLDGGVYGPGASVASTGPNAHRAVIKAASARQAGETWEDVLEYYMFNAERGEIDFAYRLGKIFYQGSIYALPGGAASGAEGVGAIPRDYTRARSYFLRIARLVWPRDPPPSSSSPPPVVIKPEHKEDGTLSFAAASAGYLGRMYLRGEGVKRDYAMARMWFERGAEFGEKECHNGLGIMLRDGLGVERDVGGAVKHFMVAANQELAEAQVNLGKFQYYKGDTKLATTYFESSIRHGAPFEPYYYLARIYAGAARDPGMPAHHVQGSCAMAVGFYKLVTERGAWGDDPVREGEARWRLASELGAGAGSGSGSLTLGKGEKGEGKGKGLAERAREDALLRWWIASERGIEAAQNNLAYVLDQDKSILRFTRFAPFTPENGTARLALTQWMRSAYQRNVDALVKVGDYYYHGLGVLDSHSSPSPPGGEDTEDTEEKTRERKEREKKAKEERWERAAAFYQSAVDTQMSALAMWNLGWMYENGVGVPQDFHLAKRHYDLALETNSEAYLPVVLSLIKLHLRSFWHTIRGGKNGLSLWDDEDEYESTIPHQPADKQKQALAGSKAQAQTGKNELTPKHVTSDPDQYTTSDTNADTDVGAEGDDSPAGWYRGKARDDHRRRMRAQGQAQGQALVEGEGEDPIQWARDRRAIEAGREDDFGPEDYFDASLRHPGRRDQHQHQHNRQEEEEDDFGETMLLVVLCLLISGLMYVRGQWFERRRREEEERRAAGGAAGAGPNPGPGGGAPGAGGGGGGGGGVGVGVGPGGAGGGQRPDGNPNAGGGAGFFPPEGDPAREEWAVLR